ncbi:MAG: rod shape-determining protein MreC [Candidatus Schekmanbacteria bacterium RBG_13_48_7]|uniref:Cell shape-determining protein MreC n=1 Tax=Candidatus Schekmanbacteria bacterium RBG_13_48_7 TaxID=1817878 RepID=A0A1F7S3K3_9BACT|nr:MAG: rod shape-determining protein MreC [Candidatus Schekmanbacteria bacterium RBG_13_48_7]
MISFWNKYRPVLVLFFFLCVSLFIFTRSLRDQLQSKQNYLKMAISSAGYPLQKAFSSAMQVIVSGWRKYLFLNNLEQENETLRRQLAQTQFQLYQLKETQSEQFRMSKLLQIQPELEFETIQATVIGRDSLNWFHTMTLDKGSANGVKKGAAVLNLDGVVGQIIMTGPYTSTLLPIIHAESGVSGIIKISRVQGTVIGTGDGRIFFKYVDRKAILSAGDLIVTSGLDRIFPKGLPIGRIINVQKIPNGLFLEVQIESAVNFSRLEETLIMISPLSDEKTEFSNNGDMK